MKPDTHRIVLVGTYRHENEAWIRERRLYNLPLPKFISHKERKGRKEGRAVAPRPPQPADLPFHRNIGGIVLFAEGHPNFAFKAKFKDVVDGERLKKNGYSTAAKPHGEKYALYELCEESTPAKLLGRKTAEVFVSSSRCPCVKIDEAFYSKPYPVTGGRSMPYIFDCLKPYFRKWKSATTFNPVQSNFLKALFSVDCPPKRKSDGDNGTLTCLDFFAGSGLVSVALSDFFKTVWANDISPKKAQVFSANIDSSVLEVKSIEDVQGSLLPTVTLSWGSFPCQDLSLAGDMNGLYASRSGLFWQWLRVMDEMKSKPPIVVAENVLGLVSAENGRYYRMVHEELARRGYNVGAIMLDALHWVPQSRKRIFVVAVSKEIPIQGFLAKGPIWCHPKPIVDVASKVKKWHWWLLPEPAARSVQLDDIIEFDAPCDAINTTRSKLDLIPESKRKWIERTFQDRDVVFTGYRRTRNHKQVLEIRTDGVAGCLRTPCGGSSRQIILICQAGRIKTRLLTVREAARLMGAPDSFVIPGTYNDGYMAMGDGVAVPVARFLAEKLLSPIANQVA